MATGYNKITAENYRREMTVWCKKHAETFTGWRTFFRLIDFPLKGKRVLDAGCGFGYEATILRRRGATVWGVDVSPYMIQIARQEYPELADHFRTADIRKLPFRNGSFDLIICKYVLHYLPWPDAAFKEFRRCLKKGGILIYAAHHPTSNLFFKKKKDYFHHGKIRVKIFHGVDVVQPTHTLDDYFSEYFLKHFDLLFFKEGRGSSDPLHPRIKIPEHFLVKARKR